MIIVLLGVVFYDIKLFLFVVSEKKMGLLGALSISVGGMIGGGVYAVLGLVIQVSGAASWFAFTLACIISLGAAYSYVKLNELTGKKGGSVTQIEALTGNSKLAGMVGWTLLFGYIGAMGMYAYAFGGFTAELLGFETLLGINGPIIFGIAVLIGFILLNLLGAVATGLVEIILVVLKVGIIVFFGIFGFYYGLTDDTADPLLFGFDQLSDPASIIIATGVCFVSFQGWQLLIYDQDSIRKPSVNVPRGIYWSIIITIILDGMIAIIVTSYASPESIASHPELAVAEAAKPFLGSLGFTIIAISALLSTGSAINGTLFSAANFAKGMISAGLLPDRIGRSGSTGAPPKTVIVLGLASCSLLLIGGLEGIVAFGSLAFMIVFGSMSLLAFKYRKEGDINPIPPLIGLIGSFGSAPILVWFQATRQPEVFATLVVAGTFVISIELLYFNRETIWAGVQQTTSMKDKLLQYLS